MTTHVEAEMLAYLPGVYRLGACSVAATFDPIEAVMRFIAFAILYSPIGVTAL